MFHLTQQYKKNFMVERYHRDHGKAKLQVATSDCNGKAPSFA